MANNLKSQIINKILSNNLFIDNRGNLYGDRYENNLSTEIGVWQMPEELAELMIFLSDKNIKRFLNIGTFNGLTFNILANFLYDRFETECISIDPINHNPIKDNKFNYYSLTSEDFKNQKFDLVFIDGDHSYNGVKLDYENVGKYAKYCVFHDIEDIYVKNHPLNNGGVPRFWNEVKQNTKHIEFIDKEKPLKIMGIGLIYEI